MPTSYTRFLTHRRSRRLPGFDYRTPGWYFVTVCVRDKLPVFGEVRSGIVGLSVLGSLAHACWREVTAEAEYLHRDAFIVMPNHVHLVVGLADAPPDMHTNGDRVPGLLPGSIGAVVRSFKSAVTRRARRLGIPFAWQPRFHDHVVRDAHSLERIRTYIENNPTVWSDDRYHPTSSVL